MAIWRRWPRGRLSQWSGTVVVNDLLKGRRGGEGGCHDGGGPPSAAPTTRPSDQARTATTTITADDDCPTYWYLPRANWPAWQKRVHHTLRDYDRHAGATANNGAIIAEFLELTHKKLKRPRGLYSRVKKKNLARQLVVLV